MKSAEQILKALQSEEGEQGYTMLFKIDVVKAMEEYASQFKNQPTDDELWDEVYLRMLTISQIENKDYIMDELKSKFKITRR